MSISEQLVALKNDVDSARTAILAKGGTVTQNGGSSQLATDISTIPQEGGQSTPTLTWYTGNTGTTITIADTSAAQLVKVYRNGILLQEGAANDYTISGTTLTLTTDLIATDKITTEVF